MSSCHSQIFTVAFAVADVAAIPVADSSSTAAPATTEVVPGAIVDVDVPRESLRTS